MAVLKCINKNKKNYLLDESLNNNFVSGNKFRKMKGILDGVHELKGILSFGSPYSSHLLACAYYGNLLGVPFTGIVISEKHIESKSYPHIHMAKKFGAELVHTTITNANETIEKHKQSLPHYHWVPGGGHTLRAAHIYQDFFDQLFQKEEILETIKIILLPYGTGTTTYGIWKAFNKLKKNIQIIGVSVSRSKEKCYRAITELEGIREYPNLTIIDQFSGKYGIFDKYSEQYRWRFFKDTGILPDPIYNSKTIHYLYEQKLENTLVVNTGGMLNNLL